MVLQNPPIIYTHPVYPDCCGQFDHLLWTCRGIIYTCSSLTQIVGPVYNMALVVLVTLRV